MVKITAFNHIINISIKKANMFWQKCLFDRIGNEWEKQIKFRVKNADNHNRELARSHQANGFAAVKGDGHMDMTVENSMEASIQAFKNQLETAKKTRISKSKKKTVQRKKKKSLGYSPREISGQLMRATRSAGVSVILIRAKGKVQYLQRCALTGNYDEAEIKAALLHAKRMVACAKKKLKNLKNEEELESRGNKKNVSLDAEAENKLRQRMKNELKKLRRKNRSEEYGKITDADMRYLKEKIREEKREAILENISMDAELCEAPVEAPDAVPAPEGGAVEAVPVSVDVYG